MCIGISSERFDFTTIGEAQLLGADQVPVNTTYSIPVRHPRVGGKTGDSGNSIRDIWMCTKCCIHQRTDGFAIWHVLHRGIFSAGRWGLVQVELEVGLHQHRHWLQFVKVEMTNDQVNIRLLREGNCALILVARYHDSKQPVEFPQVRNFHVLLQPLLELHNEGRRGGSDGAVINMYNNDDESVAGFLNEDGLVDFTLLEAKFVDEYLHELLVPSAATLF